MAKVSPLKIYKFLPGTNCLECGESSCMALASALIERRKKIDACIPLMEKKEYAERKKKLIDLLTPPVKEVTVGNAVIGGEEVMYRHDLTYFNPTALFIDVDDAMPRHSLIEKVEMVRNFSITRIGQELTLDGIAIRSKTNDPTKFGEAVLSISENYSLPFILCSYNPEVLEVGLEIAAEGKPLLYAATKDNWEAVAGLALKHGCPVVASSPGDIPGLVDLVRRLKDKGLKDIVLDIGSYPRGKKFYEMNENLAMLRRLAIEDREKLLGYPLLGVPMVTWLQEKDEVKATMQEAILAAAQILRFCDALILHSPETWALLPLLTLRQNIYTDPRVPISVEAGVREIGSPDESSPVLLTSNFALTYYTVEGDLQSSKVSCFLLVVDTEGLAVEVAMAGNKLTASGVTEALEEAKLKDKVTHKKLIIPGRAARISGEIEDETGWEVMVGPIDSSRISGYLEEKWGV
jgi:acetyl-CoA decarbonylase/synthase complex subunit gamma